jgi:hypothetical protein
LCDRSGVRDSAKVFERRVCRPFANRGRLLFSARPRARLSLPERSESSSAAH